MAAAARAGGHRAAVKGVAGRRPSHNDVGSRAGESSSGGCKERRWVKLRRAYRRRCARFSLVARGQVTSCEWGTRLDVPPEQTVTQARARDRDECGRGARNCWEERGGYGREAWEGMWRAGSGCVEEGTFVACWRVANRGCGVLACWRGCESWMEELLLPGAGHEALLLHRPMGWTMPPPLSGGASSIRVGGWRRCGVAMLVATAPCALLAKLFGV